MLRVQAWRDINRKQREKNELPILCAVQVPFLKSLQSVFGPRGVGNEKCGGTFHIAVTGSYQIIYACHTLTL